MNEDTTPPIHPAIDDRINDQRHALRHVCLHASFEPMPGSSLPVDVYLDIRVVGDKDAEHLHHFATNTISGFLHRASELGLCQIPASRDIKTIPGLRVHSIDGRSAVLSHLAKSALGSVSFISATEGMSFVGVGRADGMPAGKATFNCVSVMPEKDANDLCDLVNAFMVERGCVPEHFADKPPRG